MSDDDMHVLAAFGRVRVKWPIEDWSAEDNYHKWRVQDSDPWDLYPEWWLASNPPGTPYPDLRVTTKRSRDIEMESDSPHITDRPETLRAPWFIVTHKGDVVGQGRLSGFPDAKVRGENVLAHQVVEMNAGAPVDPVWNVRWKNSNHLNAEVLLYGRLQVENYSERSMLKAIMSVLGVDTVKVALYVITPDWRGMN